MVYQQLLCGYCCFMGLHFNYNLLHHYNALLYNLLHHYDALLFSLGLCIVTMQWIVSSTLQRAPQVGARQVSKIYMLFQAMVSHCSLLPENSLFSAFHAK